MIALTLFATFALSSGCTKPDCIQQVDVTGKWVGISRDRELDRPEYLPKTRARDGSSGTDTRARRLDTLLSRGNLARGHNQLEGKRRCAKRAGGPGRQRAGLTRGNLARLETGRHEPTRPTLRKLATAFQVKVARPDPPRVNETSNTPPPKAAPGGVARQERNAMIPTRSIFTPAEHARLRETAR